MPQKQQKLEIKPRSWCDYIFQQDEPQSYSSPPAKTTYTTLEIHVADVDDQPPYFEYPDCSPPCTSPQFVSHIRLSHKVRIFMKNINKRQCKHGQ
jgi:hypothetical protein